MKRFSLYISFIWMVTFSVGCVMSFHSSPEVTGTVTDAATGTPIESAAIYWDSQPMKSVMSRKDGTFTLPSKGAHREFVLIPMGDPVVPSGTIVIEAQGYSKKIIHIHGGIGYSLSRAIDAPLEKKERG